MKQELKGLEETQQMRYISLDNIYCDKVSELWMDNASIGDA